MRVIVTTRDTSETNHPIVFEDASVIVERGILQIQNYKTHEWTEFNSNWWNSVTYGDPK
jgi:hypothetical protein